MFATTATTEKLGRTNGQTKDEEHSKEKDKLVQLNKRYFAKAFWALFGFFESFVEHVSYRSFPARFVMPLLTQGHTPLQACNANGWLGRKTTLLKQVTEVASVAQGWQLMASLPGS